MSRIEYELPEIPESWEWLTIGEVVQRVSNIKPESEPSRAFRYVDISSIDNRQQRVSDTRSFYGADAPSRARRPVHPGDVLLSNVRVNLRNTAILEDDIADVCSTGFTVLRANGRVTPSYLFQYIKSDQFVKPLEELQTGTQYPATSDRVVFEQPIPVPPVEMQNELTFLIEEMDRRVKSVRERLSKFPLLLKRFRQSVLAAACTGQLTSDWRRENVSVSLADQIARRQPKKKSASRTTIEALDSPLIENVPESWTWTEFQYVCDEITVGFVGPMAQEYRPNGVPFLRSLNIRPFQFAPENLRYVSSEFHAMLKKSKLKPGDLAMVRSGVAGACCVIPSDLPDANCSDLVIARPSELLHSAFACVYVNSPLVSRFIEGNMVGIAQGHFNVGSLSVTPIPVPPLAEQVEIAKRVETLFASADAIDSRLDDATAQVERTTQAILAKAFRGDLLQWIRNDGSMISDKG